jgi:hypothetical protein
VLLTNFYNVRRRRKFVEGEGAETVIEIFERGEG